MQVIKRDGRVEPVKLDKITRRIAAQAKSLNSVESITIAQKVISGLYDNVTTKELDDLAIKTAANLATTHPEYDTLAARLTASVLHKETKTKFSEVMEDLFTRIDSFGNARPGVSEEFITIVRKHAKALDAEIVHKRDYDIDYLGLQTLKRSYLQKLGGKIVERPQHMFMRVAIGIHGKDIPAAIDTYDKISRKLFTHATPTLFNAGTVKPQLASCFLLHMDNDSIEGIYKTLTDCAKISQLAGGIGLHIHNIRASGSPIYGTGGTSNGIVPMARVFDATMSYIDQCFDGKTLVKTHAGYKPISELRLGDRVQTTGGYSPIQKIKEFDKKQRHMVSIKTNMLEEAAEVTDEHIFLAARNVAHFKDSKIKDMLRRGTLELEWVAAKDLNKDDIIINQ